ncbi:MAG: ABC transporter ATP-binding protein [Acidobacteria bacterium]|nr:MAG: ABC transporter ATP-binding protein [Acidobacteriota bacterium]
MSETPIVEARDLVKTYHKGTTEIRPLDGLDLEVRPGEFLALMGPSGSGKSTLLHIVGGLDQPDTGSCLVGGLDIGSLGEKELCEFRAAKVGFVFQTFNLIPILTAAENVDLPLRLLPLSSSRRQEQVAMALDIVGLADRDDHLPSQLSGGEEQRVAIARAFATDPDLIIADEPTGDLDDQTGEEIVSVLRVLASDHGKTVLMVTHDASKAERADRILYFDRGRLTTTDPRARTRAEAD